MTELPVGDPGAVWVGENNHSADIVRCPSSTFSLCVSLPPSSLPLTPLAGR